VRVWHNEMVMRSRLQSFYFFWAFDFKKARFNVLSFSKTARRIPVAAATSQVALLSKLS
jgi:hypothetical protein